MTTGYSFGARMRSAREAAGLTQEAVARRADLAVSFVGKLERDSARRPSIQVAVQLAEALGVSLDYLGGLTDHPAVSA